MGRDDGVRDRRTACRRPGGCGGTRTRRSGAACWSRPRSGSCCSASSRGTDTLAAGLSTSAMICGFVAFDAPARVRVRWHILNAPFVGLAAGLGVLTSPSVVLAVAAMALIAGIAGYLVAVSMRMAIGALTAVLALLITQGLFIPVDHTLEVAAYGVGGSLLQAAVAGPRVAVLRPRARGVLLRGRLEGDDCATSHELLDGQAGAAARAALRDRDGGRRRDLPDRGLRRPRLLGAADDPVRAQARSGPDDRADPDARRRDRGRDSSWRRRSARCSRTT